MPPTAEMSAPAASSTSGARWALSTATMFVGHQEALSLPFHDFAGETPPKAMCTPSPDITSFFAFSRASATSMSHSFAESDTVTVTF